MQPSESPLRHYLQILRRQAWLVVLAPIVALAATAIFFQIQKPVYRASTTMVVGEPRGDFPPVLGSHSVTRTLTNLLESDLIARSVIQTLDLRTSKETFLAKLRVDVLPDTSVLDVSYESRDPDVALAVVTELARIFTRQLDETLGVSEEGPARPESFDLIVRVFDAPHVEPGPVPRSEATAFAFAGILGLALGLMLAIARDVVDERIRDQKDAEGWFGAPMVGALPRGMRGKPPPGLGQASRLDQRHEAERVASLDLLRAKLEFTQLGAVARTIVVTSAATGEGKSTVAASLSTALARSGKRVICVDADLRRPSLHRYLGFPREAPGLTDVFKSNVDLEDVLLPIDLSPPGENGAGPSAAAGRLEVLPAGAVQAGSMGPLSPQATAALMELLHERSDYTIFDAPPLLVADSFPLAVESDGVLVVARRGRTTIGQAESVRTTLEGLGVEHVAVVLMDAPAIDTYA
jgi:Mrp family chromosome partitioning ATPase